MNKNSAVLFLNGNKTNIKIINKFLSKKSLIVSADGASNYLKHMKVIPDVIIGDLDSITQKNLRYYSQKKVKVVKLEEQETTDFEKALNYILKLKIKKISVFGAMSKRYDHTLNNFSVLKRYYKNNNITFYDNKYESFYCSKSLSFKYKTNKIVSFLGMPYATGIVTEGLKYTLKNETLYFGIREGTLNESVSDKVKIKFKKGDLLLFRRHFLK
jgi:thiamine pyrophosphokinase